MLANDGTEKSSNDQNVWNRKVVSNSFPWIIYTDPKTGFQKSLKSPGLIMGTMAEQDKPLGQQYKR